MSFLKSLFGAKEAKFVEVAPFGARFEVPSGETVLEAALKNGVPFPHNCTVGTCGSSKCKPKAGWVGALTDFGYTLSQQEIAAGFILACQAIPKDALTQVEVKSSANDNLKPEQFVGRIVATEALTHDILKTTLEESRVTMSMAIDGERYNKDVDHLVTFSERRSADTVNASDGLPLCEHFAAVIDTRDPKKLVRHETIFVPTPEGTTEYTEREHTSRRQEQQPLVIAALEWVNDLRHATESGSASTTLPLPLSLNGNSTWLGLWKGTAKVTLQWSFKDVSAQAAPVPQK